MSVFKWDLPISIHVPAWGTTTYYFFNTSIQQFQSTFPRGERLMTYVHISQSLHFNPRSRVGNDGHWLVSQENITQISIHVPAWGTTFRIHRTYITQQFQSTFPRGERRHRGSPFTVCLYFNPRSRVGNDVGAWLSSIRFCISIHVPAWGTTRL